MRIFTFLILTIISLSSCSDKEPSLIEVEDKTPYITEEEQIIEDQKAFQEMMEKAQIKADEGKTVISIVYPEKVNRYETADTRVVLWGEIENATDVEKIKVNDYTLQKYIPGTKKFSYIASTEYGTLERGDNSYFIQALDKKGNLLAETEYFVLSSVTLEALSGTGAETWLLAVFLGFIIAGARYRNKIFFKY